MTLSLAVSNIAWEPKDRFAAYEAMSNLGVSGLEIAPGLFFPHSDDPFAPSISEKKQAEDEIESHGLRLVSMQSLLFGTQGAELFGEPCAQKIFQQGMTRAINLAQTLEVPNLVFGSPRQRIIPPAMTRDDAELIAIDMFRNLGDRARKAGTQISLEPNPDIYGTNFLTSLVEVVNFTRRVDHPSVKLTIDAGALHNNDEFPAFFDMGAQIQDLIGHVHLSAPWLAPPPDSNEDILAFLISLASKGYVGPVSLEMKACGPVPNHVTPVLTRMAQAIGDYYAQ